MDKLHIFAESIETGSGSDPRFIAITAASKEETAEVVFETMSASLVAAGILLAGQESVKRLGSEDMAKGMANNLESSMRSQPEAIDVSLHDNGNTLAINLGCGALFLKLTDTAKQSLKKL